MHESQICVSANKGACLEGQQMTCYLIAAYTVVLSSNGHYRNTGWERGFTSCSFGCEINGQRARGVESALLDIIKWANLIEPPVKRINYLIYSHFTKGEKEKRTERRWQWFSRESPFSQWREKGGECEMEVEVTAVRTMISPGQRI